MGMANFGAFMGGLSQGQQQAQAQAERKQYLDMLMARQKKADDDTDSTNEATTKYNLLFAMPDAMTPAGPDDQDSGLTGATAPPPPPPSTAIPGTQPMAGPPPGAGPGGPPPMGANPNAPQGGAMAPQPGQASQPARPMPVQGQPPMQGRPMPPQAGPGGPPPQAQIPGQRPMPGAGPQPGPGGPPQAGAGQPPQPQPQQPQQPQQPLTTEGALQQLQVLQQKMADPIAQKIASDPEVVKAHKMTSTFIDQLRKDNVGFGPGQRKPNAVEQKELSLLHQQTELAATKAAKSVTSNEKDQLAAASTVAKTMAGIDHAKMVLKASEDATSQRGASAAAREARMASGGAGGKAGTFEDMSEEALKGLAEKEAKLGPNAAGVPWTRYRGSADLVKYENWKATHGFSGAAQAGQRADYKADAKSASGITPLADRMESATGTFHDNFTRAIASAQKAGLKGNMPLNQLTNWLREKGGDPATAAYLADLSTSQGEYAKLLTQSTGAGGSSVESLKRATSMINPNMTLDQLIEVNKHLESDGKAVTGNLRKQAQKVDTRMKSSAASGGGVAPPKTVTMDEIHTHAQKLGISDDAMLDIVKKQKNAPEVVGG